MFLICSTPVSALPLGEVQGTVSNVDHVVNELRTKHFFAYKVTVPLDQLKDNSIVQIVNKKGYIRYFVYDGLVQTENGKHIVLIKNNNEFQSQRYMTLENFQKEYTGIVIVIEESKPPTDITQEIWEIQKKDLGKKFKSLKEAKDRNQHSITLLSMYVGLNGLDIINQLQKETNVLNAQIKRLEDEMIDIGMIGA